MGFNYIKNLINLKTNRIKYLFKFLNSPQFKTVLKFFLKKIIQFFLITIWSLILIKFYFYFFELMYTLRFELHYNFYPFFDFFFFAILGLYSRYTLSLLMPNTSKLIYFFTVKFFSTVLLIKYFGTQFYFKFIFLKITKRIKKIVKKYWRFRLKMRPFTTVEKKFIYNFSKTSLKHLNLIKKFKQRSEDERTQADNEYLKMSEKQRLARDNNPNLKIKFKIPHAPVFIKSFKPTLTNNPKFFDKLVYILSKRVLNNFSKILFNLLKLFFFFSDLILIFVTHYNKIFHNIKWVPLNIRLPYFRKMLNQFARKKIITQYDKKIFKKKIFKNIKKEKYFNNLKKKKWSKMFSSVLYNFWLKSLKIKKHPKPKFSKKVIIQCINFIKICVVC